jgi:hypothetical protein
MNYVKQYFISHQGQQLGPWSAEQILKKYQGGRLKATDYIYDEEAQDWVLIVEHPELKVKLRQEKPAAPPLIQEATPSHDMAKTQSEELPAMGTATTGEQETDPTEKKLGELRTQASAQDTFATLEWYVLKGDNKFGPFSYHDVIRMLQEKAVYEFDFVWHEGLETWHRIAELDAFTKDNIRRLKTTLMPEISEVFFRRRHRRVPFDGTILVHDNNSVWKGHGVEISAGGAGVVMDNAMITPGQTLYLHFRPSGKVPPFNAICEVVSKKFEDGVKDKNTPIRYGLKFTKISGEAKQELLKFSNKAQVA